VQEKLIILRKKQNKTQSDVAKYLEISSRNYSDKELGKKRFNSDEMFKISNYFNRNISDIFLPTFHQNGEEEMRDIQSWLLKQ